MRTVIQEIHTLLQAIANCKQSGNSEWIEKHNASLDRIEKELLPSGAGFDSGTKIDRDRSAPSLDRIVFHTSFHHMDSESGMYSGWTEHDVIVTPTFSGVNIRVTGRDRKDARPGISVKEYIADAFDDILNTKFQAP